MLDSVYMGDSIKTTSRRFVLETNTKSRLIPHLDRYARELVLHIDEALDEIEPDRSISLTNKISDTEFSDISEAIWNRLKELDISFQYIRCNGDLGQHQAFELSITTYKEIKNRFGDEISAVNAKDRYPNPFTDRIESSAFSDLNSYSIYRYVEDVSYRYIGDIGLEIGGE